MQAVQPSVWEVCRVFSSILSARLLREACEQALCSEAPTLARGGSSKYAHRAEQCAGVGNLHNGSVLPWQRLSPRKEEILPPGAGEKVWVFSRQNRR